MEMFAERFFFREEKITVMLIAAMVWIGRMRTKHWSGSCSIGYVGAPPLPPSTSPGGKDSRTAYIYPASCFEGWFPKTPGLP